MRRFALILVVVLVGAPERAAPQDAPDSSYDSAVALARSGNFEASLRMFEALSAQDRRNGELRVWIARLQLWTGHPDVAEPVVRGVIMEDAGNVEAWHVLGQTLLARQKVDEAVQALEQASRLAPSHADVLVSLGRAYRRAGETRSALTYLRRGAALAPTPENRMLVEEVERNHAHRIEATVFGEELSGGVGTARGAEVLVNVRVADRLRLGARGGAQRKFGVYDRRAGVAAEWQARPKLAITGQVLSGPDNQVLARHDVEGEITYGLRSIEWALMARSLRFARAGVVSMAPAATWWVHDGFSISGRYTLARVDFRATSAVTSHSGFVRGSYRVHPRLWLSASYAHGVESFETLTVDRLGQLAADTGAALVRIDLPSLTSVFAGYEYQLRSNGIHMHRATVTLVQRF